MIRRLLIADRGEIAVRIVRTCKEMNTETVAMYSTADKEAPHVQLADYAVYIGGPRASDNYLSVKNTLGIVCMTARDAIHPDFSFPSENAKFARLVLQCGLTFVGPNPDVTERTGDKSNARRYVIETGVPVTPGSKDLLETVQDAVAMAEKIGYPVLIKVSSGGGGRGMCRMDCAGELVDAFDTAKTKIHANLGDDAAYMEKFTVEPKHVKVQLMADKYESVIHLCERDCSYQRRN